MHPRSTTPPAALLVLACAATAWAGPAPTHPEGTAAEAVPAPRPPRPDRSPVVQVGSRITWNVPYVEGGTEQQTLDVYAPADAAGAPVVVFVHGGEWTKGDKSEVSFKPKFLNEQGIVLVSVNYRLNGVARHPAQVDDLAAAVRWTRDHASEHGGDPARIVVLGHSAGCHLVTLLGLDPRPLAKIGLEPADLHGIVSWSGSTFDLAAKVAAGGSYVEHVARTFGDDPAAWRDASPVTHVGAAAMPRFLFASAEEGKAASRDASDDMVRRIRAAGGRADAVVLPGKSHFTANHELGMPNGGEEIGALLLAFVRGG